MKRWGNFSVGAYAFGMQYRNQATMARGSHSRKTSSGLAEWPLHDWLDATLTDAAKAIELARERAVTEFIHHPVNPRVNNARNEGAELTEAFPNPA
jgi:hypothetical protein